MPTNEPKSKGNPESLAQRWKRQSEDNPAVAALIVLSAIGGAILVLLNLGEKIIPKQPPTLIRASVEGETVTAFAGGKGEPNPGCQDHNKTSCAKPERGGKLVPGSGKPLIQASNERTGVEVIADDELRYCVLFKATTGACETRYEITGRAVATEEYRPQ